MTRSCLCAVSHLQDIGGAIPASWLPNLQAACPEHRCIVVGCENPAQRGGFCLGHWGWAYETLADPKYQRPYQGPLLPSEGEQGALWA